MTWAEGGSRLLTFSARVLHDVVGMVLGGLFVASLVEAAGPEETRLKGLERETFGGLKSVAASLQEKYAGLEPAEFDRRWRVNPVALDRGSSSLQSTQVIWQAPGEGGYRWVDLCPDAKKPCFRPTSEGSKAIYEVQTGHRFLDLDKVRIRNLESEPEYLGFFKGQSGLCGLPVPRFFRRFLEVPGHTVVAWAARGFEIELLPEVMSPTAALAFNQIFKTNSAPISDCYQPRCAGVLGQMLPDLSSSEINEFCRSVGALIEDSRSELVREVDGKADPTQVLVRRNAMAGPYGLWPVEVTSRWLRGPIVNVKLLRVGIKEAEQPTDPGKPSGAEHARVENAHSH